jgi:hypothetical protein
MDKQQALTLISDYVDGWKVNDVERVLRTLAENCEIIESHGPTYRGREHVRQWITQWFWDGGSIRRWDVTGFFYADGAAAFEWVFEYSVTGSTGVIDGATIVRFNDGLIGQLREYRCTEPPYLWSPAYETEDDLALMARDSDIQHELNQIESELSDTESDGLDQL